VQTAWLGSVIKAPWLALGEPFLSSYIYTYGPRKQSSHHVGPPLLAVKVDGPRAMNISSLLLGGCGLGHKHVEDACKGICCVKLGSTKLGI